MGKHGNGPVKRDPFRLHAGAVRQVEPGPEVHDRERVCEEPPPVGVLFDAAVFLLRPVLQLLGMLVLLDCQGVARAVTGGVGRRYALQYQRVQVVQGKVHLFVRIQPLHRFFI